MWRYHELLPVRDEANVISLGEGATPVVGARSAVAARLGFERGAVRVKDEGQNPTASYQPRSNPRAGASRERRAAPCCW